MQRGGSIVGHRLTIPFLLSFVGVILVCISGWLGGEMAYRHGVGVEVQRDTPEEAQAKERV
jgi:uncharacterized membrane protein